MYKGQSVAVIVPAYNEESHIEATLCGIPPFVDSVIVVDDCSSDGTAERVKQFAAHDPRVSLLQNERNSGKGTSVVRGCREAMAAGCGVVVLMDGDNQMPPEYLTDLLDPLIEAGYDAAKGNRFIGSPEALGAMPKYRLIGNIFLTMCTKLASGYWSIFDSQNGYWSFRIQTLKRLDLTRLARRYDLENSLLIHLNIISARIKDVSIPARYGDERSGIRLWRVLPRMLVTLAAGFWRRIFHRYVLYNLHPVALFFFTGLFFTAWGIIFGGYVIYDSIGPPSATTGTVMLSVLPFLMGFQLLLAALVLDILSEPK